MIKARHHWFYYWFFRKYSLYMPQWKFASVTIHGRIQHDNRSVMLIGNHISWWDGFWAAYINEKLLKKHLHVMMLERELAQRPFLNKTGAYSIKKGSRNIIESLQYTAQILQQPNQLVIMFPQGSIQSQYRQKVHFEKGADWVLKQLDTPPQVILYTALLDYGASPKAHLHFYLKSLNEEQPYVSLEHHYNEHLQESLTTHMQQTEQL